MEPTGSAGGSPPNPFIRPLYGLANDGRPESRRDLRLRPDCLTGILGWLLPKLGFTAYQQWESGQSWLLGSTYIVIVQAEADHKDQPFHRKQPGLNHLAFWAEATDVIESLTLELREKGVPILYEDRGPEEIGAPSQYAVYFEDPDRIKVEVVLREEP